MAAATTKHEVGKDAEGWDVILVDHKQQQQEVVVLEPQQDKAHFKASPRDSGGGMATDSPPGISQSHETIAARVEWEDDDGEELAYNNSSGLDPQVLHACMNRFTILKYQCD
jgi:hypothetical protein